MRLGNVYKLVLKFMKITYGKNLNLYGIPVILKSQTASISIGNNCHIKSSFLSNLLGLYQRTIICARDKGMIELGNDIGISGATIYARTRITIGDKCIIGGNVKILDNDFHPVDPVIREHTPSESYGTTPITIGRNVFIGCNSLILKGSSIGDNSVIGAGSVISGMIPSNCMAAGNPAKVIKYFNS